MFATIEAVTSHGLVRTLAVQINAITRANGLIHCGLDANR
jgi:putative component of membrane protein insertase Oxa1/YidC/SpoIIIJ protein YidD